MITFKNDVSVLKTDDLKEIILSLSSAKGEKVTSLLKKLGSCAFEGLDFASVMLENDVISVLLNLDKSVQSEEDHARICSLLVLISFFTRNSSALIRTDIHASSLINFFTNSNTNVVIQALNGFGKLVIPSGLTSLSSSSSTSSLSLTAIPSVYALSVPHAVLFLQKVITVLTTKDISDDQKAKIVGCFLKVARSGIFSNAANEKSDSGSGIIADKFAESVVALKKATEGLLTDDDEPLDVYANKLLKKINDKTLFGEGVKVKLSQNKTVKYCQTLINAGIVTISGSKVTLGGSSHHTLFLETKVIEGIWKMSVVLLNTISNYPFVGFASEPSVFENTNLANGPGNCMLYRDGVYIGTTSQGKGVCWTTNETNVAVDVEVNMPKRTIHFFVKKNQNPKAVSVIPTTGGFFGLSGYNGAVVEIVSVVLLASATALESASTLGLWN